MGTTRLSALLMPNFNALTTLKYLLPIFSLSSTVLAQNDGAQSGPSLVINLQSKYDDNAQKASKDTDAIGERQDRVNAVLGFQHSSGFSDLSAAYNYSEEYYSKETQDVQKRLTGQLMLRLATSSKSASIEFQHDKKSVLTSASATDLAENTDERETISATTTLQGKPNASIQPVLRGLFSRTNYLESKDNNYDLVGAEFELRRPVSKAVRYGLKALSSETSFEFRDQLDYAYHMAALNLTYDLPRFSTSIDVGRNFQDPEFGEKLSGFFYSASGVYSVSGLELDFSASKSLSDSSSANAETGSVGDTGVGANLDELDYVEANLYRLSISSEPCRVCTFNLEASLNEIDYSELIQNSSDVVLVAASFSYQVSSSVDTVFRVENRDSSFPSDPAADLNTTTYRFGLNKTLHPDLQVGLEVSSQFESRTTEDIDSNIVSLVISYNAI